MSRALWPMARTATSAAIVPEVVARPRSRPSTMSRSSTRQEKRTSPPIASSLRRRVRTTRGSRFDPGGALLVDDRGLAVALGEDFQDAEHVGAGAPAGQLAVAEGARPPFAEEVVALGVERPARVEPADVGDAVLDLAAALEDERPVAVAGEEVAGEEPRGARPDDHGAMPQRARPGLGPLESLGEEAHDVGPEVPGGQPVLVVRQLDLGRVDEMEVVVPARVEALAEDPPPRDGLAAHAEPRQSFSGSEASGSSISSRILATFRAMGESSMGHGPPSACRATGAGWTEVQRRPGGRAEADQGDVVGLGVAGGELADLLEDRPADGLGPARRVGDPLQEPAVVRASRRAPRSGCARRSRRRSRRRPRRPARVRPRSAGRTSRA